MNSIFKIILLICCFGFTVLLAAQIPKESPQISIVNNINDDLSNIHRPYKFPSINNINSTNSRIVNGQPTYHGQFPFQVLVLATMTWGQSVCGGVLLNHMWVVSAAHCADRALRFELHFGAQSFQNYGNEIGREIDYPVVAIIHEYYNRASFQHDLCLFRLTRSITYTDRIQPAVLPRTTDLFIGRRAIAVGWGLKHTNDFEVASTLQWAPLNVITQELCERMFDTFVVHDTTICAQGDNYESVCNGDSGGPLVLENDQRVLIGVTSFGYVAGCHYGVAQGFSRMTKYVAWIERYTGVL